MLLIVSLSKNADQLFPACQKRRREQIWPHSLSLRFPLSHKAQSSARKITDQQKMIKVTKRPESASQQQQEQCDLPFLFKLGRWCEIVPRSPVIGRMVVIDLGVNVCASLSPPISPFNPQLSPGILSPSCENSAATPSPRNPRGFAAANPPRLAVRILP